MKMNAKNTRKISNLYHDYLQIDSEKELKKRNLTLVEYKDIAFFANELQRNGFFLTFSKAIAEYFKRFAFVVMPPHDFEINFKIEI
jgi:hypothetical protein